MVKKLMECNRRLMALASSEQKDGLQVSFMKLLLSQGLESSLRQMDGSVRSTLDRSAGALIRALEVCSDLVNLEYVTVDLDLDSSPTKASVRQLFNRLMQVQHLSDEVTDLHSFAGFKDIKVWQKELLGAVAQTIKSLTETLLAEKEKLKPVFEKYGQIVKDVLVWDEDFCAAWSHGLLAIGYGYASRQYGSGNILIFIVSAAALQCAQIVILSSSCVAGCDQADAGPQHRYRSKPESSRPGERFSGTSLDVWRKNTSFFCACSLKPVYGLRSKNHIQKNR